MLPPSKKQISWNLERFFLRPTNLRPTNCVLLLVAALFLVCVRTRLTPWFKWVWCQEVSTTKFFETEDTPVSKKVFGRSRRMVPILSTQKVQWAWEIEFSPVGWKTVVLCVSQIRSLVCVGGANEGKRSPQMFCLDTAKKTRFPASDRNIVVAFFSPGGWKTVLLCCPRPSGAIGRSGCGKTGKWSPRHFLFFFAVP